VSSDEKSHLPAPTVWPIGFAIGLAVLLVGLVVSWPAVAIGGAIALIFGILWVRDLSKGGSEAEPPPPPPAKAAAAPAVVADASDETTYPRNTFLAASTLGLGAVIGGLITVPVLGMLGASSFEGQKFHPLDLGPLSDYPEGQFMITTFVEDPEAGEVSRRTAYIRNNGTFDRGKYKGQPSFTVLSNRCAHLGCPVQPNGPVADKATRTVTDRIGIETLKLTPAKPAGFGCPCHGGQYDTEGNRTAGPPVRALDRYNFSIVNGHLILGSAYSVDKVRGEGKDARIKKYPLHNPGQHVSGPEFWLWPIPEIRA
jgi:Rieske Fe-S protein